VHDLEENPDVQSLTGFSRGSSIHTYDHTLQGSWFHLFQPRTSNEARLQFSYNDFNVILMCRGGGTRYPWFGTWDSDFPAQLDNHAPLRICRQLCHDRRHHTMKMGGYGLIRGNHSESTLFSLGDLFLAIFPAACLASAYPTFGCYNW